MSDPGIPFNVTVVGDESVMTADDLARLLDLLVNRHKGVRRIGLVSFGGSPASEWAAGHHYTIFLAGGNGPVKSICEAVAMTDALVVLGDPRPYRLLVWLCEEARIPVRVFRGPPRFPKPPRPAWEVNDLAG